MTESTTEYRRPDPDTLLAEIQQEERNKTRGKLKVFFGAAPGVGKTFAMLEEGRARAAEGMDVVVGYAEPHARTDTEALLLGMEILPYKLVEYRNVRLKEFDLDEALKRRPALLLVDELAHTNAPALRHPKRYQDVLELLEAGIDVYTTLNVQHLESVNDVVERIAGIKVRETLPDSILDQANEVELVDVSPEELLERLSEGKVYTSDMAERATRNFFSKANLLALRELALRRTAQRVDAQMQEIRRRTRTHDVAIAGERLLVCVGPSPLSARLVRSAKRLADGLKAQWIAASVETPGVAGLRQEDRDRVAQTLRLAAQLGAETVTLTGRHVADEVLEYAAEKNVTKIVIGKPQRPRWREIVFGSVVDDLIRRSGTIDVYVIRGQSEEHAPHPAPADARQTDPAKYVWGAVAAGAATAAAWGLYEAFRLSEQNDLSNLVMVYLLAVVLVAIRLGRGPAVLASLLSVAAFDFFFVPPRFTFAISDFRYLLTFSVMLAVALVISTLTNLVRDQAASARQRERRTAALLALSRDLASLRGTEALLKAAVRHVADVFDAQVLLLLPDGKGKLAPRELRATDYAPDDRELAVAQWAFDHDQPAGAGTNTLPAARAVYLPLLASRGAAGVIGVCPTDARRLTDPEQLRLLESFGNQIALAVERAALADEAQQAWMKVEAELLRNTLLSSVSHDLRTPLAAITGAASTLLEPSASVPDTSKRELIETIYDESERMERLISNLLDMTRLEAGGLSLKKEWQPVQEIVGSALHHLDRRLRGRKVKADIPPDLPLVHADALAIEQVLVNLIDNAVEYTPPDGPIEIRAQGHDGQVSVEVVDHGPGLPPGTEQRVFEKFFRARPQDARRGIGLGLAISKGIIDAHGGRIAATNRPQGGTAFCFTLPADGAPPKVDGSR